MITKLDYIKRIWDEKAVIVQRDPITLKSGRESHVYVNHRNFICLPSNMDIILSLFEANLSKVSNKPFALSNVSSFISPILVGALSLRTKIPFYLYRPVSSEKGLSQDIFTYDFNPSSRLPQRLPSMLIDDVVTTTTTLKTTTAPEHPLEPQETISETTLPELDTSSWKTYRNEKYGYEIKYPKDWPVQEFNNEELNNAVNYATYPGYANIVDPLAIFTTAFGPTHEYKTRYTIAETFSSCSN